MERSKSHADASQNQQNMYAENASTVAAFNKSGKKGQRSWLLTRWFQFLLQQYKADEIFDMRLAKCFLFLHFLVVGFGVSDWSGLESTHFKLGAASTSLEQLTRIAICMLLIATIAVFIAAFLTRSEIASKPSFWIVSTCILKYVHWYLTMPLSFLLFSQDLFGVRITSVGNMASSWVIILTGMLLLGPIMFMRNQLPSNGKFNSPNRHVEAFISFAVLVLIAAVRNISGVLAGSVFEFVSIGVHGTCVLIAWNSQVFWWKGVNTWYILGHASIVVGRLSVKVVSVCFEEPRLLFYLAFTTLIEILSMRLGYNLCTYRLLMRIRNCASASNMDNFILYFTHDLCKTAQEEDLDDKLEPALLFEMNQIGKLSLYSKRRFAIARAIEADFGKEKVVKTIISSNTVFSESHLAANYEAEVKDPLWSFYKRFAEAMPNTQHELFLYLLLQLVFLGKNVMSISTTLARYKKILGDKAPFSLDLFLIEALFMGRIEHLSVEDSSNEHFSRTNLGEVFSEISKDLDVIQQHYAMSTAYNLLASSGANRNKNPKDAESSTVRLDLSRVLVTKFEYLLILSEVNKLINIKTDIFSTLFEKAHHKSLYLYEKNEIAHEHANSLDKAFTKLLSTDLVGNYVLASAVSYFLKIRFDIQRAEKIFKMYQSRLSRFEALTIIPLRDISEANFQYNSVVMRINISHESTMGMLTDISPNYAEHLGRPTNNDPTGININSLFAGKMQETHVEMMRNTADQPIFNQQTDFQMNGFDGLLKPIRFILKLDPLISAGLHSIALVRFKLATNKCLLLVDEKLDLVSAEMDFWTTMQALKASLEIENVKTLSESLGVQLVLMNFLKTMEVTPPPVNEKAQAQAQARGSSASNQHSALKGKGQSGSNPSNVQESGNLSYVNINNAKDTAFNYLKLRVFEAFQPYETCGVYHQMNDKLDMPAEFRGMPLLTSIEPSKFGEDTYYRVWLTFDNNHSREKQLIWDVQATGDQRVNSAIHLTERNKESKLSDSESKDMEAVGYTASGESGRDDLIIKRNILENDEQNSATTFEKILRSAKEMTPILTLLQEAAERPYPDYVREAFKWLENFYKKQDNIDSQRDAVKIGSLKEIRIENMLQKQTLHSPTADDSKNFKDVTITTDSNFFDQLTSQRTGPAVIKVTKMVEENHDSNNPLDYTIEHPDDFKPLPPARSGSNPGSRKSSLKAPKRDELGSFKLQEELAVKIKPQPKPVRPLEATPDTGSLALDSGITRKEIKRSGVTEGRDSHNIIPIKKTSKKESQSSLHRESTTKSKPPAAPGQKKKPGFFGITTATTSLFRKRPDIKEAAKQAKAARPSAKQAAKDKIFLAQETSFSDQRSDVTSKLSQIARNMFGFRNARGGNVGENLNSNVDNKEDLTPVEITKLSANNAFISHNPTNIHLLVRYISDFKLIRRTENNPDGEKGGASISTKSTSSRGTHFLKMVNSIMDTKKGGSQVYSFSIVTIVFTLYFGIVLQYVLSSLKSYNVSNLNNFILLSNFIFLDRKLMEICETQDFLYEHTAAAWNATEYDMIRQNYGKSLPAGMNSTDFLLSQMTETVSDVQFAMRAVTDETINLIDKKDAADVVSATFRQQELDYTDRFSKRSDIYKAWVMPYFSTINYYTDVFSQNTMAMRQVNQHAWDNNYDMTGMDSLLSEKWSKAGRSKIGLDSTVFNKVLKNMGPNFISMVDSIILSAVDRHFKDVYVVLYLSIAVLVCLIGYTIYATVQINITQQDFLMNYNLLRPWELYLMVEELARERTIFTQFSLNEVQLLNQYLDFNLFASLAAYANRAARLQELFSKDKDKIAKIKKYSHDFFFFSSKFIWMIVLLTSTIFGLMGLAIYIFLSINNNRIGVENLLFDSHVLMIGIMKSYLSVTLMAIYGYFLPIAGNTIDQVSMGKAFDDFLVFQTGKRQEFYAYFGTEAASKIDAISFNDICSWMVSNPSLKQKLGRYVNICKTINNGSATKGIIGFFQFQKYFLDAVSTRITQRYGGFLDQSRTIPPSRALTDELFTSSFIEMRLGNWIVFNIYYSIMSQVATETVSRIMIDLEYYVGKVIQYIAIVLYFMLTAMYALIVRRQAYEIEICYETFKLIDPFFLMNNRYLQFRFKSAFKGVA